MLSTERGHGSGAARPWWRAPSLAAPIFIDSASQEKYNIDEKL
jgi:hypothetical protein